MFKFILKVFAVPPPQAALAALSWFDKAGTPEYINLFRRRGRVLETSRSVQRRVRGAPSLFTRKPPRGCVPASGAGRSLFSYERLGPSPGFPAAV
ncbi:MAG: hypothetical protein ACLRZH_03795 [Ruthenibacterium lactatiformans]